MGRGAQQLARAVSEGINGYLKGTAIQRGIDKDQRDQDFQAEQRANYRTDRARADSERSSIIDATRPATIDEGAGGVTKPATADNIDVGQPGEPGADAGGLIPGALVNGRASANPAVDAAAYNSQAAQDARVTAAMRAAGKPLEAAQLQHAVTGAKAAQFTLDKGMEDHVNEQFDKRLSAITEPTQLADVLSKSPLVQGREVTAVKSPDGKTVQLVATDASGNAVSLGKPFDNSADGVQKAIVTYSQSMKAPEKITALQHMAALDETRRQHEETIRHNKAAEGAQQQQLGISGAHLGIARDELALHRDKFEADLKNDPLRNLPGAVKLSLQGMDKTLGGIETAITKAQAEGQWDPKTPGNIELLARKAKLEGDRARILKPYVDATGAAAASKDYMGYDTKKPAVAPVAGAAATASPTSRPAPAPAAAPVLDAAGRTADSGPNARAGTSPEMVARNAQQAQAQAAQHVVDVQAAATAATGVQNAQQAYQVMNMPGFADLPAPTQQAVLAVANGQR